MKKTIITGLWSLLLLSALSVPAFAQELLVGGQAVGIQISTEGVLVAGFCPVETAEGSVCPAEDAGVREGDLIIRAAERAIPDANALVDAVSQADGPLALGIRRGTQELSIEVAPAVGEDGQPMLGILLRDGLSGIGTLTFCDPESGVFGALGHSVNDGKSGLSVPLREGSITDAQIVSVRPGASGKPGELDGVADVGRVLGSIERNTDEGIFGTAFDSLGGRRIEVGLITAGPASIVSTIEGREAREYAVEVNRVYRDSGGTHAMLSVTDPVLLARTGGIVQGMSGSPIIQNGRLVGAVTHVFVSDSARGYAVSIQDMLRSAGLQADKAA